MQRNTQSHFQPPPPIRTTTSDSQSFGAMSPSSEAFSPTSTFSSAAQSPASPTEESFFGAIAARVRRGRSRSRSRSDNSRRRSRSPMVLPPEQFPPTSNAQPTSPTYTSKRTEQPRHVSMTSKSSVPTVIEKPTRPSLQGPSRRSTSSSDMWRGRHSNSWLFNDISVTETAKSIFHVGRKS